MAEPVERLVNLAFFLANAREPVPRERIRTEVEGYGTDQNLDAFLRMFERDKEELRRAGFQIGSDEDGRYWIDRAATFAREVELTAEETAALRAVGLALLDDPAFPFAEELRLALAKLSDVLGAVAPAVVARTADEDPEAQGARVADLDAAVRARKRATFAYVNSRDERKEHDVEPLGLFAREGRWYLVAIDTALHAHRVYAVSRMSELEVNAVAPKSPDFERAADFDVSRFIGLPFQYGPDSESVIVGFSAGNAWRAPSITQGVGDLTAAEDDSVRWTVTVRDRRRFLRWLVEAGPGLSVIEPVALRNELRTGLERAEARHA